MSSFFPWMGGKSKLTKRLCQILPEHKCYCELFAGAANLLFAKDPSRTEVINDVNDELTNLFRVVRFHPREFIAELQLTTHSRTEFSDFKNQPGLTDIQKAARSYLILKAAFGGKGASPDATFGYGTTGKARFRRTTFAAIRRCHKRLDGVFVENLDFANCIKRYDRPHTFFYADPPYLETAGYKAKFTIDDHERLADALQGIKGRFLLSINDHPKIRKLYKGCPRLKVKVKYTIARTKTEQASDRQELVIANYPLPRKW
jgi:DNA adenine methylase